MKDLSHQTYIDSVFAKAKVTICFEINLAQNNYFMLFIKRNNFTTKKR